MASNPPSYRVSAATGLHKGDRAYQQDQVEVLVHPKVQGVVLAVIADGMGGKSGGRKAADQVLLTARQIYERYVPSADDAGETLRLLSSWGQILSATWCMPVIRACTTFAAPR